MMRGMRMRRMSMSRVNERPNDLVASNVAVDHTVDHTRDHPGHDIYNVMASTWTTPEEAGSSNRCAIMERNGIER